MNQSSIEKRQFSAVLGKASGAFTAVACFSLVINILMLTVPIYMLQVYDRVLASGSYETLTMLTVLAVSLLAFNALLEIARSRVLVRVGTQMDSALGGTVFSSIMSNRLFQHNPGQAQPLRDLESIRTFMTGPGFLAFMDAPWTPIYLLLIFLFHPYLGAIAAGGAVLLLSLAILSEFTTRGAMLRAGQSNAEANRFVEATSRNAEAIHAMGMLGNLMNRWMTYHRDGLAWQTRASDWAGILTGATKFTRPCLQVGVLGMGAYLAVQQIISPGVMIAASIIMGRALAPVEAAIGGWRGFVQARASHKRLKTLLDESPVEPDAMTLPKPKGELIVSGLFVRPPGATKPILRDVTFGAEQGDVLGVIGPSAAGKSTLAKALVGIWSPLNGAVRLDGADVAGWARADIGPYIGYVPQDVELFEGTIAENIARFGNVDSDAVVAAAQAAGAHRMILQLPEGYDSEIGEAGALLSGGQRQRIALARALYGNPAFVVLDEPNSNLDMEGEEALRQALLHLKAQNVTSVIISHRPSIMSVADKLVVLRDGQVELFGPREQVMAKLTRAVETSGGQQAAARVKPKQHVKAKRNVSA